VRSALEPSTKASIRNAAIAEFGRLGFERASIRSIARVAGVSPALVIHHYGSKEALRAACDEYVVDELFSSKNTLTDAEAAATMQAWLADIEQFRPLIDYLAHMLGEATPAADALFDRLTAGSAAMLDQQVAAGVVREPIDREVTAAYLTLYGVMPLILQRQLGRALGGSELTTDMIRRSTLPIMDLYTNGLYVDDRLMVAAREALERTTGPRSDKGENDPSQDPDPPRGPASR
jgi:TetR/AcrR family transcriptional regulator, regulator of cefoperazone and chloramphenicol sensitivity